MKPEQIEYIKNSCIVTPAFLYTLPAKMLTKSDVLILSIIYTQFYLGVPSRPKLTANFIAHLAGVTKSTVEGILRKLEQIEVIKPVIDGPAPYLVFLENLRVLAAKAPQPKDKTPEATLPLFEGKNIDKSLEAPYYNNTNTISSNISSKPKTLSNMVEAGFELMHRTITPAQDFFDEYIKQFERKAGCKPVIDKYGKDGKLVKDMLKQMSVESLKELLPVFFTLDDDWLKQTNYSIGVFKSQINKLLIKKTQVAPKKETTWWPVGKDEEAFYTHIYYDIFKADPVNNEGKSTDSDLQEALRRFRAGENKDKIYEDMRKRVRK